MNEKIHIIREAVIKVTQMLAGKSIQVTQRGISAYVKSDASGRPILVNLPYIPDNADQALIDAIQGFLDHEVAHILFTDFGAFNKTASNKSVQNLTNIVEDCRIERKMAERFQGSAQNLENTGKFFLDKYVAPKLAEALESGDTNAAIAVLTVPLIRGMSGQAVFNEYVNRPNIKPIIAPIYEKIKDLKKDIATASSTSDCVEVAKKLLKRLRDGEPSKDESDSGEGDGEGGASEKKAASLNKPAKAKPKKESKSEEPEESEKKPSKAKAKSKKADKTEEKESDEPADTEEKDEDDEESTKSGSDKPKDDKGDEDDEGDSEGKGDSDSDSEDEDEGDSDSEGEGGESDDEDDGSEGEGGGSDGEEDDDEEGESGAGSGEAGALSTSGQPDEDVDMSIESSAVWEAIDRETANGYDTELIRNITNAAAEVAAGADYLVYTKDKDVIEPLKVGREYQDSMLVGMENTVGHMVGPLQKDLERAISARSLSTYTAGHRSGRLHAANLSRLAINDPRVFRRKHEATSKDVAVTLLIDMSGSMGGQKIHTAAQAAFALASVLERISINCEVLCFTTGNACAEYGELAADTKKLGRPFSRNESLYMPILKNFTERMTIETKKRFAWLPNCNNMRNNIDGESLEVAAFRLLKRRESGKVLMVLSDGAPAGSGSHDELSSHLKRTVENISKAGVNVLGIGINSTDVKKYYPKHLILNKVEDLPSIVMKELRALLIK